MTAPFPPVNGGTPAPIISLDGLRDVPVSQLRELTFPYDGDATDAFSLTTARGSGYVDQGKWHAARLHSEQHCQADL